MAWIRGAAGLCLCFFLAALPLAADTFEETEGRGLVIRSDPSGAAVYLDGVERGTTPLTMESLPGGEYSVRLTKEGFVERRFLVRVRRQGRIDVTIELEEARGEVALEFRRDPGAPLETLLPLNPEIYVDGVRNYDNPLSIPMGWRILSAEAFGWEKHSETLYIAEGSRQKLTWTMKAASFAVTGELQRRAKFNPENSGALGMTELRFEVSAPGEGRLEVLDAGGRTVYERALGFSARVQEIGWNGRDSAGRELPDGDYTLRLHCVPRFSGNPVTKEFSVTLDSSLAIRPLSLFSGSAGLFFASMPEAIPPGSFQIDALIMAGKVPLENEAWGALPFAAGFRFSPLEKLELAAAFNALLRFNGDSVFGGGASAKWIFIAPARGRPAAAALLSYGWAREGPFTAFGMGTGAALSFPLSFRLPAEALTLDLVLTPGLLWAGPSGYPNSAVPRLEIAGGFAAQYGHAMAGLSLRWDYDPGEPAAPGPLQSALELKLFPSNLVISLLGGFWYIPDGTVFGAFFGAGLGIVF